MTGLPRFEEAARVRPVDLLAPGLVELELAGPGERPLPQPAPYAALVADLRGDRATLRLRSGEVAVDAVLDGRSTALWVRTPEESHLHRSRRHGRLPRQAPADGLALTLTGTQVTMFTRSGGVWTARARTSLTDHDVDPHDVDWLADLHAQASGAVGTVRGGVFGQLGLRDLRLVTYADGSAYAPDGRILLTATSAGPGFFATAHASVWELDPATLGLTHRADLFFRRGGSVYGDQAVHLVRDGSVADGEWLVATSTWGDFADPAVDHVHVEIGRSAEDLLSGRHVVDTEPLHLPTTGLRSVGVWDPHLVRVSTGSTTAGVSTGSTTVRVSTGSTTVRVSTGSTSGEASTSGDGEWLVAFVSARRYFDFHPVLAAGPTLDDLSLRAAAVDRRATEGVTLARVDGAWRVLASDGRDNRRRHRAAYPVFDLDLCQVGTIDAPYPTNLPWPTLVEVPAGSAAGTRLLVGFDGAPAGGRLAGYGTHGAVVIAREVSD